MQVIRWGFKSQTQLPLFMVWKEYHNGNEIDYAKVIFSTRDMREKWWWRNLFYKMEDLMGAAMIAAAAAMLKQELEKRPVIVEGRTFDECQLQVENLIDKLGTAEATIPVPGADGNWYAQVRRL